ncbi:hypothetical protein GCM10007901_30640 [Dyella acidisoli]|uniref:Uncharacterized protein n=1 Tax=Dyella acidisoli TaxID=1867834 RepID=A0ABQ5XRB7_9GAMM|nr:hypothetical protein GCM10007901_30640 [Dyella acidisoli]
MIVQLLAHRGEDDTATLTNYERLAERIFQQAQLAADGTVGDVQFLSSAADAAEPGRGLEGTQGIEGRQVAHGSCEFF